MKTFLIGFIIFAVIGIIVFVASDFNYEALLGVGLAAVISIIIITLQKSSQWSGTIEKIYEKRVNVGGDEEGNAFSEKRLFANIRLDNGRRKNLEALSNWQVGDRLIKKRGRTTIDLEKKI